MIDQAILFINWTDEDFTHTWDGTPFSVASHEKKYFPAYLARHFAKHLAIREMNKLGMSLMEKDATFISMMDKAVALEEKTINANSEVELAVELMNAVQDEEKAKKKGNTKKVVVAEEEKEVFEGL
jgi:predicted amidohydrolase YtcJ